jgi:hypothetical protein
MKIFLFFLLLPLTTFAQLRDTFQFEDGGRLKIIEALRAENADDFTKIGQKLKETTFPVNIITDDVLKQIIVLNNKKDQKLQSHVDSETLWREREAINNRILALKDSIISNQNKQVSLAENTNDLLNNSIKALNEQLNSTRELAKDGTKGRNARNIWAIIVGGGIGFGLGAILGLIAN